MSMIDMPWGCRNRTSVPRVAWRPRKRNRIAHVRQPRDVRHRALEPEPEPRVRYRAVATQVAIPAVVLLVYVMLVQSRIEHIESLFALTTPDDLADPRGEHIHRRDGLPVVVDAHVERLDGLRVVQHDYRLLRVLLGEITLVLGLKVDTP